VNKLLLVLMVASLAGAEILQYDDGTPTQQTFEGIWRGVAFDVQDFTPDATGFLLQQVEYWFYDSGSPAWETADFWAEVFSGGIGGPEAMYVVEQITALHYAPVYLNLGGGVPVPQEFWCVASSQLSTNGSPSLMGDAAAGSGRSFFSNDLSNWTPWTVGDYIIRAHGENAYSLEATSWGQIKNLP